MDIVEILTEKFDQILTGLVGFLPRLLVALALLVLFLILTRWLRRFIKRALKRAEAPPQAERLFLNIITVLGIAVGLIVVLGTLGVNVAGLAASIGLTGIVIGFALKDVLENLMAGTLLLIERPFNIGDAIQVGDFSGTVTDVVVRATTIRTFDGVEVVIPNKTIYTSAITNYSTYPVRRRELLLQVGYGEDLTRVTEAVLAGAKVAPGVAKDPAPSVWLSAFGGGAIDLTVHFWVDTTTRELLETHSDVLAAIQAAVNREGLDVAPASTHTVFLREERSS